MHTTVAVQSAAGNCLVVTNVSSSVEVAIPESMVSSLPSTMGLAVLLVGDLMPLARITVLPNVMAPRLAPHADCHVPSDATIQPVESSATSHVLHVPRFALQDAYIRGSARCHAPFLATSCPVQDVARNN